MKRYISITTLFTLVAITPLGAANPQKKPKDRRTILAMVIGGVVVVGGIGFAVSKWYEYRRRLGTFDEFAERLANLQVSNTEGDICTTFIEKKKIEVQVEQRSVNWEEQVSRPVDELTTRLEALKTQEEREDEESLPSSDVVDREVKALREREALQNSFRLAPPE